MMPVLVSFIGWHNSGKTTFATKVVAELIHRGRKVAVVKSTKESGTVCDKQGSDSSLYHKAGATVLLAGDDFLFLQQTAYKKSLAQLATRFFSDMELVVGEGFKQERGVAKIEVFLGEKPQLVEEVDGVVAVVGKAYKAEGWHCFSFEEVDSVADFIEGLLGKRSSII